MKLYEIVELYDENEHDKTDQQMYQDQKESIIGLLEEKSSNIVTIITETKGNIEKVSNEIKRLTELKKRQQKKLETINNYISWAMQEMKIKKVETTLGTASLRKSEQVIIENETDIPGKFKTIVQSEKINKTEIKQALKNGEEVSGAKIQTNQNLIVK